MTYFEKIGQAKNCSQLHCIVGSPHRQTRHEILLNKKKMCNSAGSKFHRERYTLTLQQLMSYWIGINRDPVNSHTFLFLAYLSWTWKSKKTIRLSCDDLWRILSADYLSNEIKISEKNKTVANSMHTLSSVSLWVTIWPLSIFFSARSPTVSLNKTQNV